MSTITRRRRGSRLQLSAYRRHELLTGEIVRPVLGYDGYADSSSDNLEDFISDQMKADWATHREELLKLWRSGEFSTPDIFPNTLPWLYCRGSSDILPWACAHLD